MGANAAQSRTEATRCALLGAATTKLEQITSLFLARLAVGGLAQRTGLALCRSSLALGQALLGFSIERLRFRGTAADQRQCLHHHGPFIETGANLDLVAHPWLLARFAALAATMHLAAFNRRLGQGTGFIETRRPQPLVQPNLVVLFRFLRHWPSSN